MNKRDKKEFDRLRYDKLISLWMHHDGVLLNWLPVVIAIVAAAAAFVELRADLKGNDARILLGATLLVLGVFTFCIVYAMKRVRHIRNLIKDAIKRVEVLENIGGQDAFDQLNHPPGLSGNKLLIGLATGVGVVIFGPGLYVLLDFLRPIGSFDLSKAVSSTIITGLIVYILHRS